MELLWRLQTSNSILRPTNQFHCSLEQLSRWEILVCELEGSRGLESGLPRSSNQPTNQPTHCSLLMGSLQAAREDGCSYGWKFGGITPPLTHDEAMMPCCIAVCTEVLWQIDSGLSFGDVECHLCGQVATKITIQQLMVQTTENESESESGPADANRFAEVSTLQNGSI